MHLKRYLTEVIVLLGVCALAMIVLWDWPRWYLNLVAIFAVFVVALMSFVGYTLDQISDQSVEVSKSILKQRDSVARALNIWFAFTWAGLIIAIVSFREGWTTVQALFLPIKWLAQATIPAVYKIPSHMAAEGFDSRIAVTEVAAAIGYLSAICLAGIFIFSFWWKRNQEAEGHWTRQFQGSSAKQLLCFVFGFVMVGVSTYVFFDPLISKDRLFHREWFADFETSDLSLFFRMVFYPATAAFVISIFPKAMIVVADNRISKQGN